MQADFAAKNISLRLDTDLLNNFWHDRPGLPESPIFVHEARFSPESVPEKLARVRAAMKELGAEMKDTSSVIFLGRHVGFPVALEGALKLKEISYIHAEGFAALARPRRLLSEHVAANPLSAHTPRNPPPPSASSRTRWG